MNKWYKKNNQGWILYSYVFNNRTGKTFFCSFRTYTLEKYQIIWEWSIPLNGIVNILLLFFFYNRLCVLSYIRSVFFLVEIRNMYITIWYVIMYTNLCLHVTWHNFMLLQFFFNFNFVSCTTELIDCRCNCIVFNGVFKVISFIFFSSRISDLLFKDDDENVQSFELLFLVFTWVNFKILYLMIFQTKCDDWWLCG